MAWARGVIGYANDGYCFIIKDCFNGHAVSCH
jgi:hypothetical protein